MNTRLHLLARRLPSPAEETLCRTLPVRSPKLWWYGEIILFLQRTTTNNTPDDLEPLPTIAADAQLTTTTSMSRSTLGRHTVGPTCFMSRHGCPWRIVLVALAGKIAAVSMQWDESVVVLGFMRAVTMGIFQQRRNQHLHMGNCQREYPDYVKDRRGSHGEK